MVMAQASLAQLFSENLRAFRRRRGLTQQALAERAGLSVTGLQRLEAGDRWPRAETIEALAQPLGCHPLDLFSTTDPAADGTSDCIAAERPKDGRERYGHSAVRGARACGVKLPASLDATRVELIQDGVSAMARLGERELRAILGVLQVIPGAEHRSPPRTRR
jgi:transcriptional regulator with XRE-family HTH domain